MEFDPAEVTRAFEALRVKRDTELTGLIRHPSIHAGETQQVRLDAVWVFMWTDMPHGSDDQIAVSEPSH